MKCSVLLQTLKTEITFIVLASQDHRCEPFKPDVIFYIFLLISVCLPASRRTQLLPQ